MTFAMKMVRRTGMAALAWALACGCGTALAQQPNALPALPGASAAPAPAAPAPGPRLMTPEQKRDEADSADLRTERAVKPQISIPLGRKAAAPSPPGKPITRVLNRGSTPAGGGIDDAAARCEAQPDTLRAQCRDKLSRENGPR